MSESLADRDGVIWFDGELVPWREAKVHVLTHTLTAHSSNLAVLSAYLSTDTVI